MEKVVKIATLLAAVTSFLTRKFLCCKAYLLQSLASKGRWSDVARIHKSERKEKELWRSAKTTTSLQCTTKTHDKPVSVDLQRVQKRQVSSFFHGPIAASFALGPEKEKKITCIPRNENRGQK